MKLETIWLVTQPTPRSRMNDICFECDARGLQLQFLGGLTSDQIVGMYTTEFQARQAAESLLHPAPQESTP